MPQTDTSALSSQKGCRSKGTSLRCMKADVQNRSQVAHTIRMLVWGQMT